MLDAFPDVIKQGMKKQAIQLAMFELQHDISSNLETLIYNTSVKMIMSGLYSTNPLKGIPYLLSKFRKARSGNKLK